MRTILVALTISQSLVGTSGLAAPATPVSTSSFVCDTPARPRDDLMALLAASGIATPAATTASQTLPKGIPASAVDAAAMETTIQQWLACQNAGEPLRAWSLFTDGYLYRLLNRQGGVMDTAYTGLATPTPSKSEPAELQKIEGERVLPDGRLGATAIINYPSIPMPKRFFFYFTRSDDHLLIDGILGEISFSVP